MVIKNLKVLTFLIFFFAISFISASYTLGKEEYSIEKIYSTGDNLSGWVNISFNNEPSYSIFNSSGTGNIKLIDLLNKLSNKDFDYTCNLKNCEPDYSIKNSELKKTFNLEKGVSAIFGIQIKENFPVENIESFKFLLESNNPETIENPLSLDILDNNIQEWKSYKVSSNYGDFNYGCFSTASGQTPISSTKYCEKIILNEAPGLEIGAYVTRDNGEGNVLFEVGITEVNTGRTETCTATASAEIGIKEKISCSPDFQIKEGGEYYVCIILKNPTTDGGKYKIGYEEISPCGFSGNYNGQYRFDFEIFARLNKYASNININFNNTELEKSKSEINHIEDYIWNYLQEKYENNCTMGCIIPIRIIANVDQQINISNLRLVYNVGVGKETNGIFDVEEEYPLITADFQKLFLDEAGLQVSNVEKEYDFSVYFNNKKLFEEKIEVEQAPSIYYLTPMSTAKDYPTSFYAGISSQLNILKYKWNFSDGVVTTTEIPEVSHTYKELGRYPLTVTITNSRNRNFSKEFEVVVGPASEIVPSILRDISNKIKFIEDQLIMFSNFQNRSTRNALNLDEIKSELEILNKNSETARTESDYENILKEIIKIKIPESVGESFVGEGVIFYPYVDVVNLDTLKNIGGGSYNPSKEKGYQEAVLSWQIDNAEIKLNFSEISAIYPEYQEPIVKVFEISIQKFSEAPLYFIMKDMENLIFYTDYSFIDSSGYKYIQINSSTKDIIFSTTESIDFEELPIFVSPSLTEIVVLDLEEFDGGEFFKKWGSFILIIIGILVVTFIVYIVLQIWYKKKYEEYLFKNRNNLYNLVNYIKTSFGKGMKEGEIEKNLRKAKWNSEQIRYAMRKYHGKNTGMPEIPIKKIVKRKKEE